MSDDHEDDSPFEFASRLRASRGRKVVASQW